MPLLVLARLITGLLGLLILGASAYLIWSWFESDQGGAGTIDAADEREDWRLWTGLALLAWSLLGRLIVLPLLAKPDGAKAETAGRFSLTRGEPLTIRGVSGDLAVNIAGPKEGNVIVLTHGWGLDSSIWTRTRERLATRYRVIAWDLPGMGRSKGHVGATQLDVFAQDLQRVIECAGDAPVLLVGHSIGGMTIQTLARQRPGVLQDLVSGIALLNTTYRNPCDTMWAGNLANALRWPVLEPLLWLASATGPLAQLLAWQGYLNGHAHLANRLGFAGDVTRSELDATTLLTIRNRQDVQARGNLAMFRWDASDALPTINVPTLVVAGGKDLVTKEEAGRTIASKVPGAQLHVVKGANHMGVLEQWDDYTSAIERFAAEVFSQPRPNPEMATAPARKIGGG